MPRENLIKSHLTIGRPFGVEVGLVTLHEVKRVRARWAHATLREIMGRHAEIELPVLDGGRLLGLVSRGAILRFLRTREALHL